MTGHASANSFDRLSPEEERANRITHGAGLVLSLVGAFVMYDVLGPGDLWRTVGCGVYLASMIAVYALSTLSHAVETPRWRAFFRALDQGAIYLLIAATYTPFSMAYLRSAPWWMLLAAIWSVAIAGFLSKVVFAYRVESVSVWPCLMLGGMPLVAIPTLLDVVSIGAVWWMLLGMGCYVLGLVFFLNDSRVRHFHAVWHILVIAGSACHFTGILLFVVLVK